MKTLVITLFTALIMSFPLTSKADIIVLGDLDYIAIQGDITIIRCSPSYMACVIIRTVRDHVEAQIGNNPPIIGDGYSVSADKTKVTITGTKN